jgi:dihydrofolate reductase
MDSNNLIGNKNTLPWHLPEDLKYFKSVTTGKPILMGKKTFLSIGKPLPNRRNIVLTRDQSFRVDGVDTVGSLAEALELSKLEPELMVIGGSSVYEQILPQVDRIYLTKIDGSFDGDTYFPSIPENEFIEVSRISHNKDAEKTFDYHFIVLDRKNT